MALFCAAIRKYSVSLLNFPFQIHIQVFSCDILSVCHLKYPNSCFSSHLFSSCSVDHYAICTISGHYNQSFFVFIYVVLDSLY